MSEIRRLRDETRSGFVHALLVSTDADRSEAGACDRALAALGVGAAGAIAASAAAKAAAVAGSPTAGAARGGALSIAPTAAKGGAVLFVKWAGIALLGGAAAVGTVPYALHEATRVLSSEPASKVESRGDGPRSAARSAAPSLTASRITRVDSPRDTPGVAIATAIATGAALSRDAPAAAVASGAARAAAFPFTVAPAVGSVRGDVAATSAMPLDADAVARQLAALSAVRAALAGGDPLRALALLDEFDRRNRLSHLTEEATVLRVDALVDAGRVAEAAALANAFLSTHPASVYGERVRSKVKSP